MKTSRKRRYKEQLNKQIFLKEIVDQVNNIRIGKGKMKETQTIKDIRKEQNSKEKRYIHVCDVQRSVNRQPLKFSQEAQAKSHTKHGQTRCLNINDSIRQGGVLSVLQYQITNG